MLFMSVTLDGPLAVRARAHVREAPRRDGREMHNSTGATRSRPNEALERMGADVMRWLYSRAGAEPEPELRLRPGARDQAAAAHALELGQVLRRLREHRGFQPACDSRDRGELEPLDRWLLARDRAARRRGDGRVRAVLDAGRRRALRGVRRRSLELVHPPLASALLGRRRRRRCETLWYGARAVAAS